MDYVVSKSNPSTSFYYYYPLCSRAWLHLSSPSSPLTPSMPSVDLPAASLTHMIDLPKKVRDLISRLPTFTMFGTTTNPCRCCFVVADAGAKDHMFPDKPAFISYKAVSNLQVCMGNNAFIPILRTGTAIITLNGKRILVRNALHVPGLVIPLYSLCAHLTQHGYGFIEANEYWMLVFFPQVVLLVDILPDCHLSYKTTGSGESSDSLHYI